MIVPEPVEFAISFVHHIGSGLIPLMLLSSVGMLGWHYPERRTRESFKMGAEPRLKLIEALAFSQSELDSIVVPASIEVLCCSCSAE
jgi:hypothetical protein